MSSVVTDVLIYTGEPIQVLSSYTGEGSIQVLCIGSALLCGAVRGFPALWGMVERAEASIRLDGVFLQLWISLVV